jgi:hypothetical protein
MCALSTVAVVPVAKISVIENGWAGEGLAIHLDSGDVVGCGYPLDFGVGVGHPAYKDIVAIALSAMASGANVELMANSGTCIFGSRTQVNSIRIKKS